MSRPGDRGGSTWRPLRRRWTDVDAQDPRPIRESLDAYAARIGAGGAATTAAVFAGWEDIVGPTVAAHSTPVSILRKTLVVQVDDPAWATQLRFLASSILQRLEAVTDTGAVTRIDVRVRRR